MQIYQTRMRSGPRPRPSRSAGAPRGAFSLIELVMVVALLAVMLALTAGSMDGMLPEYRLRGEARKVGAEMARAKGEALASGRDVYLGYDLNRGKMWLWVWRETPVEERTAGEPDVGWIVHLEEDLRPGVHITNVIFGTRRTVTEGTAMVRVSPMGTADQHIVNLVSDEGQAVSVKLNGITGVVSYGDAPAVQQEYHKEFE